MTHQENIKHSFEVLYRQSARGERSGSSKLTEDKVLEIRKRLIGGAKVRKLADEYGVSHVAIVQIKHNRTWTHI